MKLNKVGLILGVISAALFIFFFASDAILMRNDESGANIGGYIFVLPAAIISGLATIGFFIGGRYLNRE